MGVTQRLAEDLKRKERAQVPNDPEPLEMYMEKPKSISLNRQPGVFHKEDEKSINCQRSVFDRTAIFQTNKQNGEMDEKG